MIHEEALAVGRDIVRCIGISGASVVTQLQYHQTTSRYLGSTPLRLERALSRMEAVATEQQKPPIQYASAPTCASDDVAETVN